MDEGLYRLLDGLGSVGLVVVLTGAGISAESGIPTFRGKEGYWTIGSQHYHPQEMATRAMFALQPAEVWRWYLYRRGICWTARPNAAHEALARLEERFSDRFLLVTQNVDGLHLRAGNTASRIYQIHGDIDHMRCSRPCCDAVFPIPAELDPDRQDHRLTADQHELLRCPCCKEWARPHILWFDESYDEVHYRYQSALTAATRASLLLVVGTSGNTNLPLQMGYLVARRQATMIEVNLEPTPFTRLLSHNGHGTFARGPATEQVPVIVERLIAAIG
ncbi:MAG: hypothetical protein JW797_19775 [Bradymonadales bacterium]|nr:hypothetical protein [Bradymonadales bacterium]